MTNTLEQTSQEFPQRTSTQVICNMNTVLFTKAKQEVKILLSCFCGLGTAEIDVTSHI